MSVDLPDIPPETIAKWQRVVDLVAKLAQVPASLIMRTELPNHTVFVSSRTEGNPYAVGHAHDLDESVYCFGVFRNDGELVIEDSATDPDWTHIGERADNMKFYIGYPLKWPGGERFGTICVLDRQRNEHALLFREGLQAFGGVVEASLASLVEIAQRERLESALQKALDKMEERVAKRTRELEEANTALRVLLSTAETARRAYNEQLLQQINTLVVPHIAKAGRYASAESPQHEYLELAETNLRALTSSLSSRMTSEFVVLSASEVEVAQLVMRGKTSKEIATTLSRSTFTVDFHRKNIRVKLGLRRGESLRRYLLSIR